MNQKERCNACRWCHKDKLNDMICTNGDSEYCTDYVDETHWCEDYESK